MRFQTKTRTIALLQRTLDQIVTFWLADVDRMNNKLTAAEEKTAAAQRAQKVAETRLRDSENRLAAVRARVSHAARVGLLTHRGDWPADVVDAVARTMYGWPEPIAIDGIMRLRANAVLDAAARAIHRDHVHVAPRATEGGYL